VKYVAKPNVYVLGSVPELDLAFTSVTGDTFAPSEVRLSVKQPDGEIITVSGDMLTVASGYLYYLYKPPTIGWYEYEGWGKDNSGREVANTNGFEVIDRVY
jgi:hypothetical protein